MMKTIPRQTGSMRRARALLLSLLAMFSVVAGAAPVTPDMVSKVAQNFIANHIALHGEWNGTKSAVVESIVLVRQDNVPLAYNVTVHPSGHLLVAYDDDFSPVLLYSDTWSFDAARVSQFGSVESWIIPEIREVQKGIAAHRAELSNTMSPDEIEQLRQASDSSRAWQYFDRPTGEFAPLARSQTTKIGAPPQSEVTFATVGPLLSTSWNQGDVRISPFTYNTYTPTDPGSGGCPRTLTGCVATATSQIMRYWSWPTSGTGSHSYTWTPPTGAGPYTVSANFAHSYNWAGMPASLSTSSSATAIDAVGRLMSDVGAAFNMAYGCSGSSASTGWAGTVLPQYFGYQNTIQQISRSTSSSTAFFAAIKAEFDATPARPVLFTMRTAADEGHAVVADGYQTGVTNMVHINMGWGGQFNSYYDISSNWTAGYTWLATSQNAYVGIQPNGVTSCSYSLGSYSLSAPAGGQLGSVSVSTGSTCTWTATSGASWITITSGSSGTGSGNVGFSIAANSLGSARSGTLTVAGQTYFVTQAGASCSYQIAPGSSTLSSPNATTGSVALTTGASCTWNASSDSTWLTLTSPAAGTGSTTVNYSVATNVGDASRSGNLTIGGTSFNVTQAGNCSYAINPSAQTFSSAATSGAINVLAGATCSWTAVSNVSWITVTVGASGVGFGNVSYTVAANTTSSTRVGTATIARQTLTVTQSGSGVVSTSLLNTGFESGSVNWSESGSPIITNDPSRAHTGFWFSWLGGYDNGTDVLSQDFTIPAGTQQPSLRFWYYITTNETLQTPYDTMTVDVFSVASGAKLATLATFSNLNAGTGWAQSPSYDLSAFVGQSIRLSFTAKTDSSLTTSFYIDDVSLSTTTACTYSLSPSSQSIGSGSVNGTLTVTTSPASGCPWTASSNASWLTSSSAGNGTGTATFSAAANTTGSARSGTLTIAGQTFTLNQGIPDANSNNLLQNPDFESGSVGWTEQSSGNYAIITSNSTGHGGSGYAWLGGYDGGTDTLYQNVTIPANTSAAYVQYWYSIRTNETSTTIASDTMTVAVYSVATGLKLATLASYSNLTTTPGWVQSAQFDVTAYKGQTIRLQFSATTNATNTTSFFIDDVSLTASLAGSGTQAQSISFTLTATGKVGNIVALGASASSGLAITYLVATPTVCSVSGNSLTLLAVGVCTVSANQSGNSTYSPATAVTQNLTVSAASLMPLSMRGGIDIDGNGKGAVVVQSSVSMMAGRFNNNQLQFTPISTPGVGYRLIGVADFDGNGKSDLAFQNMTQGTLGDVKIWKDFNSTNEVLLRQVKQVWDVQAVGDLDGDGYGDLVWRFMADDPRDTGVSYIWFTNGAVVTQVRKRGGAPLNWKLLGAMDLNADGAADMIYISPDRQIKALMATPSRTCANLAAGQIPTGFTVLKLADFTGNHLGDILLRDDLTGQVAMIALDARGLVLPPPGTNPDDPNASCSASSLTVTNTTYIFGNADPTWQLYATGDLNGDGVTDVVWKQSNGQLTVWLMNVVNHVPTQPTVISNAGSAPAGFTPFQP